MNVRLVLAALCCLAIASTVPGVPVARAASMASLQTIIGGGNRTLTVTLVRAHGSPFTVDPARFRTVFTDVRTHAVLRLTAKEVQTLGSHPETRTWYSVTYTDAAMIDLHYELPPSVPASMYELRFENARAVYTVDRAELDVDSRPMPSLVYVPPVRPPAGDDSDVRHLRQMYVGQHIYGIGSGIAQTCGTDESTTLDPTQAVRVVSLRRRYGSTGTWNIGGTFGDRWFDSDASFLAIDPIEITFVSPYPVAAGEGSAPQGSSLGDLIAGVVSRVGTSRCSRPSVEVSDRWEFERMLTLQHPYRGRGWPQHYSNAVSAYTVVAGMTPGMVAEVWGYPAFYGSRREMEARDHWTYGESARPSHSVHFRRGRVDAITVR